MHKASYKNDLEQIKPKNGKMKNLCDNEEMREFLKHFNGADRIFGPPRKKH